MSKILTIDFDIIMSATIELYNDIIGEFRTLDKVLKEYPKIELFLEADLFIYAELTRYLTFLFKRTPANKIFFISEHQKIIPLIQEEKKVELINIDHHHDIGYDGTTINTKIVVPHCGNWVKYLTDKGLLKSYTWIYDDKSLSPQNNLGKGYLTNSENIKHLNLYSYNDFDKIIICHSPQWIPPNVQALYTSWVGIAEEYYGKEFKIL